MQSWEREGEKVLRMNAVLSRYLSFFPPEEKIVNPPWGEGRGAQKCMFLYTEKEMLRGGGEVGRPLLLVFLSLLNTKICKLFVPTQRCMCVQIHTVEAPHEIKLKLK